MNDHDRYCIQHEITNLTEGLAGEQQDLNTLRRQVNRAEVRITNKQNRLRELRIELERQQQP